MPKELQLAGLGLHLGQLHVCARARACVRARVVFVITVAQMAKRESGQNSRFYKKAESRDSSMYEEEWSP